MLDVRAHDVPDPGLVEVPEPEDRVSWPCSTARISAREATFRRSRAARSTDVVESELVLDGTIVNVALPHIQTALGFSDSNLEWVVNVYALAFGGLLLLGGRSGDLLGRHRIFIAGILVFAGASLPGGFATDQARLLSAPRTREDLSGVDPLAAPGD